VIVLTDIRRVVASVTDPEIPMLTIEDLGILREVDQEGEKVEVTITPTYSGCPAMRQIEDDIISALGREGFDEVEIVVTHNPPWTTDWITADGHRKLQEYGIAPPTPISEVVCPQCSQGGPRLISRFGSTACKALMVCSSCGEPFDYFKQF
jgi:ring-1,2-phenylacetyl-CoA epoxidase subunit PaaD